jgi:hypothetical protein
MGGEPEMAIQPSYPSRRIEVGYLSSINSYNGVFDFGSAQWNEELITRNRG